MKSSWCVLLVPFVLTVSSSLLAQEVCTNGLDDDNDGLIDLYDPDCQCSGIANYIATSIIPNPSFEDTLCCPTGNSQMICANFWQQASEATSDYIHECGYFGQGLILPPRPFPDGSACVGIAGYVGTSVEHDYVGACLPSPLERDTNYTLQFYLGFGIETTIDPTFLLDRAYSAPSFEIAIYGNPTCNQLPFNDNECPTAMSGSNWELITTITVSGRQEWVHATTRFTPRQTYNSIVIGAPCGTKSIPNDHLEYYFIDNLVLSETKNFSLGQPIQEGSVCDSSLQLVSPFVQTGISYQWYRDSIALVGATNSRLFVGGGNVGGSYQVRISVNGDCGYSRPIVVGNSGDRAATIQGRPVICRGDSTILEASQEYQSYRWSTGDTTSAITIVNPGDYELTVTDEFGCMSSDTISIEGPFQISVTADITPSMGTDDNGVIRLMPSGGTPPYDAVWHDSEVGLERTNLSSGIYYATITDRYGCSVVDSFFLSFLPSDLEASISVKNLDCHGDQSGRISIQNIVGGIPPYHIRWSTSETDSVIDQLPANEYGVTITDQQGEEFKLRIPVSEPDPIMIQDLTLHNPSCASDTNGSISFNISGGTKPYDYFWNNRPSSTIPLSRLGSGRYVFELVDANDCPFIQEFDLDAPSELEFSIRSQDIQCYGESNGQIISEGIQGGTPPYDISINGTPWDLTPLMNVKEGDYQIILHDANQCSWINTISITSPEPVSLDIVADKETILAGTPVQLEGIIEPAISSEAMIKWEGDMYEPRFECPTCLSTMAFPNASGYISLTLEDNGCIHEDDVYITVEPQAIYIPNAFSPNGDGSNDRFTISSNLSEFLLIQEMAIYDRWGGQLFTATREPLAGFEGWDGTRDGRLLPSGVYVYVIRLENARGDILQYSGDIYLQR